MKRMIFLNLSIMISIGSQGQALSNVFSQKSADIKSMGKQIALFQLYMGWIEKGYGIARSGLNDIGVIKRGELNLHHLFFGSLTSVNPVVKSYAKLASVIEYQLSMINVLTKIPSIKNLTKDEMRYLLTVKENLLKDCVDGMDNLVEVISDNSYQMTDDERIKRIDAIYLDLEKNWVMAKEFTGEANRIAEQRQWEAQDIQNFKNLE